MELLAGDIGGTKTVFQRFLVTAGNLSALGEAVRYESTSYQNLDEILTDLLQNKSYFRPSLVSLGIAGPVTGDRAVVTNLPWIIDAESLRSISQCRHVFLFNDLESLAIAVPQLSEKHRLVLNAGKPEACGNIVVVAPGTGLGIAFLGWDGKEYRAFSGEGGHSSFSPLSDVEIELLQWARQRFGHVSSERVCSGSALYNLYSFLKETGRYSSCKGVDALLDSAQDRGAVIALEAAKGDQLCNGVLGLCCDILAGVVGDMSVTFLPRGGIYLGGGMPPRLLPWLRQSAFLERSIAKGRFSELCREIPLYVITDPSASLTGVAFAGLNRFSSEKSDSS